MRYSGRYRTAIDLAVNLPFVWLYAYAASMMARGIWKRYRPDGGWLIGVAIVLLSSLAFAVGGVAVGEVWSVTAENIRIGTGHLGARMGHLPWARYQGGLFALLVVLFWCVAAIRYRSAVNVQPLTNETPAACFSSL